MRLLGWATLGLTIYLYCGLEFPTLSRPWHRDSTKLPLPLDRSIFSPFPTSLWAFQQPISSFNFSYLYLEISGETMITSMVSAMRGLISLVVSGCLGGSGAWWVWQWNWFPFQQICLTAILPKALPGMQGIACLNIFLIAREWFAEQELGGETRRVLMLTVHSPGFWAIRSLGM